MGESVYKFKGACNFCKKIGHKEMDCFAKKKTENVKEKNEDQKKKLGPEVGKQDSDLDSESFQELKCNCIIPILNLKRGETVLKLVELEFESLGKINCLIDSGSCVSVVKNAVVFNKCNLRKLKKPITIVGIGNAKTSVSHFVEVVFGEKINNFLVVPDSFNISQEMLLGNDFLIKQNVEINFKNNTIRVNKQNLKMTEEIFEFSINKGSAGRDSSPDQSGSESQSENSFSDQSDKELDNAEISQENSELSTGNSSASKSLCKRKRSQTKSKKDKQMVAYKVAVSSSSESDSEEETTFKANEAKNAKFEKFVLLPRTQALKYVWVSSEKEGIIPKRCWGEQIYNAECLVTPVNGRAPVLFMNASEKQ